MHGVSWRKWCNDFLAAAGHASKQMNWLTDELTEKRLTKKFPAALQARRGFR